jgi:multiple sugar transport system ATP-binding protein
MTDLRLSRVKKTFGTVAAIAEVDLEVKDGEFVVFVGPSGCGKSTLLRIIAGLEKATAGEIWLGGRLVNDVAAADRGLAMVFQSYALYPHMTVRENLAFGLENTRTPRAEIEERVTEAVRMLRIGELLRRKPRQLSGGQRQRVAIGRALVRRPGIFLLDEPLSNLDAELRVAMRAELAALRDRIEGTMIYVTHDQVEAMTLADRIVVLNAGRVEQVGAPLELFNDPASRFVAGFIGSPRMNFLEAELVEAVPDGAELRLTGGATVKAAIAPAGDLRRMSVGFRPQQVVLAGEGGLPLKVGQVEQLGSETILHCASTAGEAVVVAQYGQRLVKPGETLHLDLDRTPLLFFSEDGARVREQRKSDSRH